MPSGGYRAGSGQKKGKKQAKTILKELAREAEIMSKELAREAVRNMVIAALEPLTRAQIANAIGIKYLVYREKKTGKFVKVAEGANLAVVQETETIEVHEKDPSIAAYTDLMNRAIGMPEKPPEQHELKGELIVRWQGENQ